jgi:hypothetical protein
MHDLEYLEHLGLSGGVEECFMLMAFFAGHGLDIWRKPNGVDKYIV